jgi:single-strand DNA-binding protein
MRDINKILLSGRLGNQPTRRETKNGLAVVNFSLATSRKIVEGEGADAKSREETQWHKVVVWGKQAESCNLYLTKGQKVFVEGMMRSRKYTNKDGDSRLSFEVHADYVNFLSPSRRAEAESSAPAPSAGFEAQQGIESEVMAATA